MIKIAGLQKMTLIDYPGKIAASVFLAGCNFRCGYCHNPELIEIKKNVNYISEKDFFDFLKKRKGILEGICISGGEPLIYSDLADYIKKIKKLDYLIKLDTNGSNFQALKNLLEAGLLDFIAMDIKSSLDKYDLVTGVKVDLESIKASIDLIMSSGIDYELRTTVLPKYHDFEEIEKIAKMIKGAKIYYLQKFQNHKTYQKEFLKEKRFTDQQLEEFRAIALKYLQNCKIRN